MRTLVSAVVLALAAVVLTPREALASGVDPGVATPVQREQAQGRFMRGKELFTKQKFAEALVEFQGSHDIVASPNARLYIARCYRELGKLVAAYAELGRVAAEAREHEREDPRYAKTASAATEERDAITPQLGFVKVTVDGATPETRMTVAGDEIKRAGWSEPAPVVPGTTEVVVETPGHAPQRQTVTLAAAETKAIRIDAAAGTIAVAEAAPPPVDDGANDRTKAKKNLRLFAFVAGGVGVAGLATFAVAGTLANGPYSDLKDKCQGGPCPASERGKIDSGKTEQTIANVGLVVGAVGVAAGMTLFVLSIPSGSGETKDKALALDVGPSWMGVRGAF
jgi:hypothetical protein